MLVADVKLSGSSLALWLGIFPTKDWVDCPFTEAIELVS